jgi:RimJ/RimL family protein N-acetyltransferase
MANLRYRRVKSPFRETPACRSASPTAELALLHTLAAPIDANRRPEFMGAVATKLEAAGPAAVGPGALHRTAPSRLGAIGYGVVSSRKGQGLATEIGRGLLRLAFDTLELHRVDAQCRTENHASRRVMAKLGMREEGVFRDNLFVRGEWWSTVQSAILSTDDRNALA